MTERPTAWAFLDWPHPIPFAHRGGAAEFPENTLVAFAGAVALGYRYLETDVRTTADGRIVTFHDEDLDRATDRTGPLSALTFDELRTVRLSGEPIPLLEDVLAAFPDARVYIDAKDDASVPGLVTVLARTGAHDRVCIGSFVSRRAARLRTLTGGMVCTWMGASTMARLRLASLGLPQPGFRDPCMQVPVRKGPLTVVDRRFVDAARGRQVAVHVYTIDAADEMERLLDLGVDGILSNRPSLLKEVFVKRGLWV